MATTTARAKRSTPAKRSGGKRRAESQVAASSLWQARLGEDSEHYDELRRELGLTRTEAIRLAMQLLERMVESERLVASYHDFYGEDHKPVRSEFGL